MDGVYNFKSIALGNGKNYKGITWINRDKIISVETIQCGLGYCVVIYAENNWYRNYFYDTEEEANAVVKSFICSKGSKE